MPVFKEVRIGVGESNVKGGILFVAGPLTFIAGHPERKFFLS
jgi:hypothetical protein